ncbi:MAG: glycerol-3-phosphate 1-O-acyltransferase PlsY [Gemmataceae bacterium]
MNLACSSLVLAAYLIGAIPFGYLVGRLKGVDLFKSGSGNIGATNAGRVLGRTWGVAVFVLDFLKGAVPVAAIVPVADRLGIIPKLGAYTIYPPIYFVTAETLDSLRVWAAAAAFLGHLFPVYLGFRGGKGVATGAGAVSVLVPGPTAAAVIAWVVVALLTRYVSLASVAAVVALVLARLAEVPVWRAGFGGPVTAFCVVGSAFVVVKHKGNLRRLWAGTESRIGDGPMRQTLLRGLHLLAVGFWFGGAGFFNFAAAPAIFESFKQVVADQPSDRTANVRILPADAPQPTRDALASALAGSAVGPVFPRYFLMQAVCGLVAVLTAAVWVRAEPGTRVHLARLVVLAVALGLVVAGWAISDRVSELRLQRFDPNPAVADAARAAFGPWHLVSLALSGVTTLLAGVGLALGARLPK